MARLLADPPVIEERLGFHLIKPHGHQDLVQAVAFNTYGDRCATGSVDGRIRVFNRHREGLWRICDTWTAHAAEIVELQWLPPTMCPSLLASLGGEGGFKLWAEDPAAVAGRRFVAQTQSRSGGGGTASGTTLGGRGGSSGGGGGAGSAGGGGGDKYDSGSGANRDAQPKAALEMRSGSGAPARSFTMKHNEDTRHTHLALLAADGNLAVFENEEVENLSNYSALDEWNVFDDPGSDGTGGGGGSSGNGRPARGEETAFRVRFDPNPEVCYTALRAGVPTDALGLVVAAMDSVKIFRTRDTLKSTLGLSTPGKEFYLAAELGGHRGLVRDVAWAPGNIRGYDIIATACQDGYVRVFRVETPSGSSSSGKGSSSSADKKGWSTSLLKTHAKRATEDEAGRHGGSSEGPQVHPQSGIRVGLDRSRTHEDRRPSGQPGQIRHVVKEIAKLDSHRRPVWRVGFDDDGQILGSVGDDGKLMCYRQTPDGSWAKSSELAMVKLHEDDGPVV